VAEDELAAKRPLAQSWQRTRRVQWNCNSGTGFVCWQRPNDVRPKRKNQSARTKWAFRSAVSRMRFRHACKRATDLARGRPRAAVELLREAARGAQRARAAAETAGERAGVACVFDSVSSRMSKVRASRNTGAGLTRHCPRNQQATTASNRGDRTRANASERSDGRIRGNDWIRTWRALSACAEGDGTARAQRARLHIRTSHRCMNQREATVQNKACMTEVPADMPSKHRSHQA
jgi:hypothetical protein